MDYLDDANDTDDEPIRFRRRFLQGMGASGVAGIAGCLGNLPGMSDDDPDENGDEGDPTSVFEVSELAPAEATITEGETVDVSATITNAGEEEGTQDVEYRVDGDALASEELTLGSGEDASVSFEVGADLEAGTHTHGVYTEDDEATGTLDVAPDVSPDVHPESVTPGAEGLGPEPPADATVLWDGADATLDRWQHPDGRDAEWEENPEYFGVVLGTGDLQPREPLGDCHVHVEWRVPEVPEGGNSGLFMMGTYEFQIVNGSGAGSFYPGDTTLRSPVRPIGEWQEYDLVWRGPRFEDGELVRPPQATLFFNGVAVLVHYEIPGATGHPDYLPIEDNHPTEDGEYVEEAPFALQDHNTDGDVVHFRNVWYRELPDRPVEIDGPGDLLEYGSSTGGDEPPEPVSPGGPGTTGEPPADADVLIDGDLDGWQSANGGDPGWNETGEYVEVEPGAGDVKTEEPLGDCQLHLEFRVPEDAAGIGPDRGASGIAMLGEYEIQILDNWDNPVEPEEWAGAYVDQAEPHASPVREPGEWQQFDIVWQGPRFDGDELTHPARTTAFLNGVAVQTRLEIEGPNADGALGAYEPHASERPLRLRDEGSRVQFRNTWVRSLD